MLCCAVAGRRHCIAAIMLQPVMCMGTAASLRPTNHSTPLTFAGGRWSPSLPALLHWSRTLPAVSGAARLGVACLPAGSAAPASWSCCQRSCLYGWAGLGHGFHLKNSGWRLLAKPLPCALSHTTRAHAHTTAFGMHARTHAPFVLRAGVRSNYPGGESGIVYVLTRKDAETLAQVRPVWAGVEGAAPCIAARRQ